MIEIFKDEENGIGEHENKVNGEIVRSNLEVSSPGETLQQGAGHVLQGLQRRQRRQVKGNGHPERTASLLLC